jgi:hypothetical protein
MLKDMAHVIPCQRQKNVHVHWVSVISIFFFRSLLFNISGLNPFYFFRVFQYMCVSMITMDHRIHLNELTCAHSAGSRLTASSA